MPIVARTDGIDELSKRFTRAAIACPREFVRARQSIVRAAGTEQRRSATATYNLPQSRIGDDMRVKDTDVGFVVVGYKRPISFASYKFTRTNKGLAGRIVKKGKRSLFKGGFYARGLGGGNVPFVRTGEKRRMTAGRYVGQSKQPLKALYGPSVADIFKDTRVAGPMRTRIWERARREMTTRLARLTKRNR